MFRRYFSYLNLHQHFWKKERSIVQVWLVWSDKLFPISKGQLWMIILFDVKEIKIKLKLQIDKSFMHKMIKSRVKCPEYLIWRATKSFQFNFNFSYLCFADRTHEF